MRIIATFLFFISVGVLYGQTPKVPHRMHFAGMTLIIREDARHEIQKEVNKLTKSPHYFNIKVERAKTYFPIIEKIFAEERLPEDFKFLALQESALISDAVSSSNAVGYWQFKDFTAEEVGMRVDQKIDERMNLVSSTRGAAKYLKKNNFYFNNWICALQAYQMGAGGVRRVLGDKYNGAKHMEINSKTYWYVKTYLAHKIAFEKAVKGTPEQQVSIHKVQSKTSLKNIAKELSVSLEELKKYNKWAKKEMISDDKEYAVLIPGNSPQLAVSSSIKENIVNTSEPRKINVQAPYLDSPATATNRALTINKIPVIWAQKGESLAAMASRAGTKLSSFLRYNDISHDHTIIPGVPYFTAKKRDNAVQPFHQVEKGENAWEISQRYGVKLKKLKKYNNLSDQQSVSSNSILWLSDIRSKVNVDSSKRNYVLELDEKQAFDWGGEVQIRSSGY